jgi:hypothetical protein
MNEHPQCIQKPVVREALAQADAVYVSIWNMDCPDCATWLHNGLIQLESVLKVDVFYQQGVGVIIFVPSMMTPDELLRVIQKIGREVCHYYGAEIIGHSSAKQALRLE